MFLKATITIHSDRSLLPIAPPILIPFYFSHRIICYSTYNDENATGI